MAKCWAAVLGGCSSKVSREHIVSDALWSLPNINVVAFAWCKRAPRRIGKHNLTVKHLCAFHNSALSPTDAEAQKAWITLRNCARLAEERAQHPATPWSLQSFQIDGTLLERWFLKTWINIAAVKENRQLTWVGTNCVVASPPQDIVRAAFGLSQLIPPRGLYAAAALNEEIYSTERLDFAPLFDEPSGSIAGGVFTFCGHRFLMYVGHRPLMIRLELPKAKAPNWRSGSLNYRLRRLQWTVNERLSHYVDFKWLGIQI